MTEPIQVHLWSKVKRKFLEQGKRAQSMSSHVPEFLVPASIQKNQNKKTAGSMPQFKRLIGKSNELDTSNFDEV